MDMWWPELMRWNCSAAQKKSCPDCLTRKNRAGEMEYFHRSVVCMTVGKATTCDPGAGNAEVEGRSGKG